MSSGAVIRWADPGGRQREVGAATEALVLEVLRSGRYVGGPVVHEAEGAAARLLGRQGAVGVASGTDALMLGLVALGVRPGDRVLVPAFSFFATAGAVLNLGAEPVFVDVDERGCLDAEAALREVDRSGPVKVAVAVHLFGNRSAIPEVGAPVLDDAAQAVGALGPRSFGALTAVSAYPTKIWGAAGDGGFVVGDDPELLRRVRLLGNHGLDGRDHEHHAIEGWWGRNSRLDAIQAAVLVASVGSLEGRVARRQALARAYDRDLPPWVRPLGRDSDNPAPVYPVAVAHRDEVQRWLGERGVESRAVYPLALPDQPGLRREAPVPQARALARVSLCLPLHEGLSDEDVARVVGLLHDLPGGLRG